MPSRRQSRQTGPMYRAILDPHVNSLDFSSPELDQLS